MADCVSRLQKSPSPSAKMAQPLTKSDWSLLPEELLHLISKNLEDHCFDVIHARSVCSSWRSTFPFPSCLLRPSYSLPILESKDLCTIEKVPFFLFRVNSPTVVSAAVSPSEYFLGRISQDDDHRELPSPLQCSVKVENPRSDDSDPTLMNMLDCQILSLGHQYRMIGWDANEISTNYSGVAFLPLNKDGGRGEFVVFLNYSIALLVLRSVDMEWMWLKGVSDAICQDLVTFRGRFYAAFVNGDVFVIDPYSLQVTPLISLQPLHSINYLVPSGDVELFLVEKIIPACPLISFTQSACRVSRLDEEARKWVEVSDLGDRVLFIGHLGNFCCSAKELPDGCGLSRNSIFFTYGGSSVIFGYKYEERKGRAEDNLSFWELSSENRVMIFNTSLWIGC